MNIWNNVASPPLMSPPTMFGLCCSKSSRTHHMTGKNAVLKTRCEPLDLGLQACSHVRRAAVGNMAIAQSVCLPCGARDGSKSVG